MTNFNWPALRAFERLARPLIESSELAADADAGFDGGEWSRGWHATELQDDLCALSARVALAFDIDPDEFEDMRHIAEHECEERAWLASFTEGAR